MYKEKAIEETMNDCKVILERTGEMIEDFIAGKSAEKYNSTQLAKDIAKETGLNLSLVAPLVSLYIKRDERVESNKGRYNGGLKIVSSGNIKLL